jgi:hypothetical protein
MKTLDYNKDIQEFRIERETLINGKTIKSYFIHDYYPTNRYKDVDSEIGIVRRMVFDFKDGRNATLVANRISNAINHKVLNLMNACICIIPASTSAKTLNRYLLFTKLVSDNLKINNCFSAISNKFDREELKGKSSGDKIGSFKFDENLYKGRIVYLFDDVCTSGTSFRQTAEKLLKTGAVDVIGVFLAKTVWENLNYGSDYEPEPEPEDYYDPSMEEPEDGEDPEGLDEFLRLQQEEMENDGCFEPDEGDFDMQDDFDPDDII